MEIEVQQPCGVYLKAFVIEVFPEDVKVSYENNVKPDEYVTYDKCRMKLPDENIITKVSANTVKIGDQIDAYLKQPSVDYMAWQKVRVRDIKADFVVVESIEGPANTDIPSFELCRPLSATIPLKYSNYKEHIAEVPNGLTKYFENTQSFSDLTDIIKNISVQLTDSKQLKISSFSASAIQSAQMLLEMFFNNSKQKMVLMERVQEASKLLSKSEGGAECVQEFAVCADLMGLAIGSHGVNISNARNIDGINDIIIDESQKTGGQCIFKILATNEEAALQARSMLEFVLSTVPVPRSMVGQIIGKAGRNIQDIVDKSGVIRVQIDDSSTTNDDGLLSENVGFIFTGTKEAIKNARLLIEVQIKHLKDMDALRERCEEMNRMLYLPRGGQLTMTNGFPGNGNMSTRRFRDGDQSLSQGGRYRNGPLRASGSRENKGPRGEGAPAPAASRNGGTKNFRQNNFWPESNANGGPSKSNDEAVKTEAPMETASKKNAEKPAKFEGNRRDNRSDAKRNQSGPRNRRPNENKTNA